MGLFDKLKQQALQQVANLQSQLTGTDASDEIDETPEDVSEPTNVQAPPPPIPAPPVPPAPVTPQPQEYSQPQANVQPSAPQQNGNNDGIYGNYLEHLIDMALADGELTEKEKRWLAEQATKDPTEDTP